MSGDGAQHTSPHDSQHDLALSIARAVKLGLPAPDSEEAITASLAAALTQEGGAAPPLRRDPYGLTRRGQPG